MAQEIEVKVDGDTKELVIRTGDAAPIEKIHRLSVSGDIYSVSNYLKQRKAFSDQVDHSNTHIIMNRDNRTIILISNEKSEHSTKVIGTLLMNTDLKGLAINQNRTYDHQELLRKLKFFGVYFKDRQAHADLINGLMNFKAKVDQEIIAQNNNKGASQNSATVNIALNSFKEDALKFMLVIQIFKGMPKETIVVEICFDLTATGVVFWLESVELKELEDTIVDKIFTELEKDHFSEYLVINE